MLRAKRPIGGSPALFATQAASSARSFRFGRTLLRLAVGVWLPVQPSPVGCAPAPPVVAADAEPGMRRPFGQQEEVRAAASENLGLPPWVLAYPNAVLEGQVHVDELQESGYFTLTTNDSPRTAFDFYQLAYGEKVNGAQFTRDFAAYAPGYGELWFTGASNEHVRLAVLATERASSASRPRTAIHVSYTRSAAWTSPYRHPMNDVAVLTDFDLQPMRFECEVNGEDDFFAPRPYLKAVHFTHRRSLANVTLDFRSLLEAAHADKAGLQSPPDDWRSPPWVALYPAAKVIAAAVDAKRRSGVFMLSTEHPQRQVHQFYNERLRESYLQFGFQRLSWSEGEEFSTTDWARDGGSLVSVITLQDKSPQTVIVLRYQGDAAPAHPVKHHRRPARRR